MEELKQQLEIAEEIQRTAGSRYSTFKEDVYQVIILESNIREVLCRLEEKKSEFYSVLSIRACLQRTQNAVAKELNEVKTATLTYEAYQRELGRELSRAEDKVTQVENAVHEYEQADEKLEVSVVQSRQNAAWEASRKIEQDYSRIKEVGWNAIFPPVWTRCGWRSCLMIKSSLRKQFMCKSRDPMSRYIIEFATESDQQARIWSRDTFCISTLSSSKPRKSAGTQSTSKGQDESFKT